MLALLTRSEVSVFWFLFVKFSPPYGAWSVCSTLNSIGYLLNAFFLLSIQIIRSKYHYVSVLFFVDVPRISKDKWFTFNDEHFIILYYITLYATIFYAIHFFGRRAIVRASCTAVLISITCLGALFSISYE